MSGVKLILSLIVGLSLWISAGEAVGQCASCTITFSGNGNPLPNRNVQNNDVVCVTGDRSNTLNLQNATNVLVCISPGVTLSGSINNISAGTIITNFGQYGTSGSPRNLTLGGNSALFINEGTYFGNFTSNNGADITNRGTITGSVTLNSGTANYINSGTQTGSLTANSGTSVTNDGIMTLSSIAINSGSSFLNAGNTTVSGNFDVNGTLNNQGSLSVVGNFTGNGGSTITNSGNLGVTGNFTANSTINSSVGALYIGGDLTVNGSGVLNSGNTSVDGNSTNNGTININGQLAINGNFTNNGSGVVRGGSSAQCNGVIVQGPNFTNTGTIGGGSHALSVNKSPTSGSGLSSNSGLGECACSPRTAFSSGLEVILIYNCPGTFTWSPPDGLTRYEVLVVGGGGSGGNTSSNNENKAGGGGGAGAVISQTFVIPEPGIASGQSYSITVGTGGQSNGANTTQRSGGLSSFSNGTTTLTAPGGGAGGRSNGETGTNGTAGLAGSAGGGAGAQSQNNEAVGGTGRTSGGNSSSSGNSANQFGGGGGGASSGANGGSPSGGGGSGGSGTSISIGFTSRFGGGGGGGSASNDLGSPGIGGGGIGGNGNSPAGNGLPNTGAGGGGAGGTGTTIRRGGNGGTGVVIIRYELARILPVEFLSFDAVFNQSLRSADLNWSTAKEWENSHFEIQRAIHDVKAWITVGEITGNGYSDTPSDYDFQDLKLPANGGNIFYRLKQVDFNGNFTYSETRAIQVPAVNGSTAWIGYPNPSSQSEPIRLELFNRSTYQDEQIVVQISDVAGVKTETTLVNHPEEVQGLVNSYLQDSRAGLFVVQLRWGTQQTQLKLIRR